VDLKWLFKVLVTVISSAASTSVANAKTILSKVLTSCENRAVSSKFRRENRELFPTSSSSDTDHDDISKTP
jgi:hypothetical protein